MLAISMQLTGKEVDAYCNSLRAMLAYALEGGAKVLVDYQADAEDVTTGYPPLVVDAVVRGHTITIRIGSTAERAADESTCPRCEGSGKYSSLGEPSRRCVICRGTGKIGPDGRPEACTAEDCADLATDDIAALCDRLEEELKELVRTACREAYDQGFKKGLAHRPPVGQKR